MNISTIDTYTIHTKHGNVTKNSLVMIRLETNYGYSNTWWRVVFCDNDDTIVCELEKQHWHELCVYKKGEIIKFDINQIQHVWKINEEFCYKDSITICDCKGLCRNS